MIAAFVVFIIIIMTFLFCDSSLVSNLTQSGIEDMKGGLGTPGIPYFFLDFPQLRQEGGSLLPLEVQSFPPPTFAGGRTSITTQPSDSIVLEDLLGALPLQRLKNHLPIKMHRTSSGSFDLLKLQAQEGKNGWEDKE